MSASDKKGLFCQSLFQFLDVPLEQMQKTWEVRTMSSDLYWIFFYKKMVQIKARFQYMEVCFKKIGECPLFYILFTPNGSNSIFFSKGTFLEVIVVHLISQTMCSNTCLQRTLLYPSKSVPTWQCPVIGGTGLLEWRVQYYTYMVDICR